MNKFFLIVLLFLFAACDGKIYDQVHDESKIGISFKEIEVVANNESAFKASKEALRHKGFKITTSDYMLRVEHRDYKKACTNPLSKTSSDYNYDGLASITLFYKGKKIYSAYKDFKGEVNEKLFMSLIDNMIEDMQIR